MIFSMNRNKMVQDRPLWFDHLKLNINICFMTGFQSISPPWFFEKSNFFQNAWYFYEKVGSFVTFGMLCATTVGMLQQTEVYVVLTVFVAVVHAFQISVKIYLLKASLSFLNLVIRFYLFLYKIPLDGTQEHSTACRSEFLWSIE